MFYTNKNSESFLRKITLCKVFILIIFFLFTISFNTKAQDGELIDYSKISLLKWLDSSPPESYQLYLDANPRLPLRIDSLVVPRPVVPPVLDVGNILVFVNNDIYEAVLDKLNRYLIDIQEQGYNVTMFRWYSGTVENLKANIQTNSSGLSGVVLIGNMPTAWFEIEDDFTMYGYTDFPCDLFLMDMDGDWDDFETTFPMQTGVYDTHTDGTGDVDPEIFIGRIDASMMTYNTEVNLLNNYFDKLHDFYIGVITGTDSALTYTEDDWSAIASFSNDISNAYPDYESIIAPNTDRDDYRDNRLDSPTYEFIQLACHSGPTRHVFTRAPGVGSTWLTDTQVRAVPPDALFYNLFCCSSQRYTTDDFLGGSYIFNNSPSSLATIGSTKTGSMLAFSVFYEPLGQGKSIGQSLKEWFNDIAPFTFSEMCWHYGMAIIGDPLLTPCQRTDVDVVQVLDRSGSMRNTASITSGDSKLEILKFAADEFIQMMKPNIGNQLGIVQFNSNVVPFTGYNTTLQELITNPTDQVTLLRNAVNSIVAGGATSNGDGLDEARNQFNLHSSPGADKIILLVTDGKENSPKWISDVQADLISDGIIVHPLGLGYGSGINTILLTDLAAATGGDYRITADPLIFRKFFIEILAGAVNWSVIVDPIGELISDEVVYAPVKITSDMSGATFTVFWDDIDNAVSLSLISPSGEEINQNTGSVKYVSHPRYIFYQFDFPLSKQICNEWAGEWKMKLIGNSTIGDKNVRYSSSALAEGGAKIESGFDNIQNKTGERIRAWVKFKTPSYPLPSPVPTVKVYCDKPLIGIGNIMHDFKYDIAKLKKDSVLDMSLIDIKLQILRKQNKEEVLMRGRSNLILYDDGKHNDRSANDGFYANSFDDTKVPGDYTFRFVADDIPSGDGKKTTREWSKSFNNQVNIIQKKSIVSFDKISSTPDIIKYKISVMPKDAYGNFLGPGYPVTVKFNTSQGEKEFILDDNIDGTYTKQMSFSKKDAEELNYTVNVIEEVFVYNNVFPKWGLSVHSGIAIPTGVFANDYTQGFCGIIDLSRKLRSNLSLIAYLGFNDFKTNSATVIDNYWLNLNLNLHYRRPLQLTTYSNLFYYLQAGPGYYIPEIGNSAFGSNLGLGFDYDISGNTTLTAGADYHTVFGEDIQFIQTHGGIIFRF